MASSSDSKTRSGPKRGTRRPNAQRYLGIFPSRRIDLATPWLSLDQRMTAQIDTAQIVPTWEAALEDATISSEDARLYCLAGGPHDDGRSGIWFEPSSTVYGISEFPFSAPQLTDLNSPAQRSKHRIGLFVGIRSVVLAAKLRHELEHACQWDTGGKKDLLDFSSQVYDLGSTCFGGLPQSGRFYNLVPTEQDANKAAASFARARFSPATIAAELERSDAVLFRSPTESDPASIGPRMLAFAAIWSDAFERLLEERALPLAATLALVSDDGVDLWRELSADAHFTSLRKEVTSQEPTEENLRALSPEEVTRSWVRFGEIVEAATACANAKILG